MTAIYEIYRDANGRFRFWLIAENGKLLLRSKPYSTKRACDNAVASVKKNSSAVRRFERRNAEDGKGYFVLRAANHRPLGRSKLFQSTDSLEDAIEEVRKNGPQSPIYDLTANVH